MNKLCVGYFTGTRIEIIFLRYFNIVIQSLDRLGQGDVQNAC
jgi:hypothetical protein